MPLPTARYLSRKDIEDINLGMPQIIEAVEEGLTEKALKRAQMPAKHWMEPRATRWFGAMSSIVPSAGVAAVKWQSGSSENAANGLPYITGLLILNDLGSGLPLAVMDSTWITAMRTAAETAVAAKHLSSPNSRTIGMIGCGVQARTHIEALRIVRPSIAEIYAYDINETSVRDYSKEMERRHGLKVVACGTPREAVEVGDIVVTGGPIEPDTKRVVDAGWLKQGGLGVPLDYDCYWKKEAFAEADLLLTDDRGQLTHLAEYGYFVGAPPVHGELGDVVAGLLPGRQSPEERIISLNMGVAVEDATTARRIFDIAEKKKIGAVLSL